MRFLLDELSRLDRNSRKNEGKKSNKEDLFPVLLSKCLGFKIFPPEKRLNEEELSGRA